LRPGDEDVILMTDLVDAAAYPAEDLLEVYLSRWGIETGQAHDTSSERWCGAHGTGYHQRLGAA
jgi:hypothetical protein